MERDAEKAEYYLRRSAERGNKYAAYTLGKALLDGDVLQQDIPRAVRFLKASADQGVLFVTVCARADVLQGRAGGERFAKGVRLSGTCGGSECQLCLSDG